jgi:hypothetical protein
VAGLMDRQRSGHPGRARADHRYPAWPRRLRRGRQRARARAGGGPPRPR